VDNVFFILKIAGQKPKISKQKTLCYNLATMFKTNYFYFANNDNNNDDPCIVGRSFAG